MKRTLTLIALVSAIPAVAEETRQLDAHEHGVGELNIAIEGKTVAMELHAPGADIVGFEYEAKSDADLSAVEAAIATLSQPLDLFVLSEAANCTVVKAHAALQSEDEHDDHKDDEHAHDEHDDHKDDEHAHVEHDDHEGEAGHTEFHAEYTLACDAPEALKQITFAYFQTFPNAQEVEVRIITTSGAQAFEVERDTPVLNLER